MMRGANSTSWSCLRRGCRFSSHNGQLLSAARLSGTRPLRALKRVPGMPLLVQWILSVLPKMGNVLMLWIHLSRMCRHGALQGHFTTAVPGFEETPEHPVSELRRREGYRIGAIALGWGTRGLRACMSWLVRKIHSSPSILASTATPTMVKLLAKRILLAPHVYLTQIQTRFDVF